MTKEIYNVYSRQLRPTRRRNYYTKLERYVRRNFRYWKSNRVYDLTTYITYTVYLESSIVFDRGIHFGVCILILSNSFRFVYKYVWENRIASNKKKKHKASDRVNVFILRCCEWPPFSRLLYSDETFRWWDGAIEEVIKKTLSCGQRLAQLFNFERCEFQINIRVCRWGKSLYVVRFCYTWRTVFSFCYL